MKICGLLKRIRSFSVKMTMSAEALHHANEDILELCREKGIVRNSVSSVTAGAESANSTPDFSPPAYQRAPDVTANSSAVPANNAANGPRESTQPNSNGSLEQDGLLITLIIYYICDSSCIWVERFLLYQSRGASLN